MGARDAFENSSFALLFGDVIKQCGPLASPSADLGRTAVVPRARMESRRPHSSLSLGQRDYSIASPNKTVNV